MIPGGGVIEESDRSGGGGGNRWPKQETLALLKIRSDMDGVFRYASLKGPLWEEVSRKMAELGFQRSAKKCNEKFENVYKYHKRTKDGRASKPDGKSYRFFDQLDGFESTPPDPLTPPPPPPRPPPPNVTNLQIPPIFTVSSTSPTPRSIIVPPIPNIAPKTTNNPINSSPFQTPQPPLLQPQTTTTTTLNASFPSSSTPSSSCTSSDERRRGRKRKWKDYFERLMRDAVQKQEELHNKFLDELEKRELDRVAREEAWRAQETDRMNRERHLLVQERSMAAARDTAMIAFLDKVTNEHNLRIPIINNNNNNNSSATQQAPPPKNPQPQPSQSPPRPPPLAQLLAPRAMTVTPTKTLEMIKIGSNNNNNGGDNFIQASSSRWPKAEIQALIKLRTSLDIKYQDNGPKGPLWEEISGAMAKLGYSRSAKRCKEKWENINKYYKKLKESNKKRPEDSKTCPYFQLLEEIYKEKAVHSNTEFNNPGYGLMPENPMAPIIARSDQKWHLPEQQQQDSLMYDNDSDQNNKDYDDEDDEDEDEDDGGGYEIIANKQQQPSSLTNTVE